MSPILVRPVREQLEHDRVIRALQAKLKRKFEVIVNAGNEATMPLRVGRIVVYPDLVLTLPRKKGAIGGVVEVETAESINHLEAMAQWAHFARSKAPFSLYVPAGSVDMARRLCADHQISVDEIWTFFAVGTQLRFTLAFRAPSARTSVNDGTRAPSASARRPAPAARARAGKASRPRPAGRSGKAKASTKTAGGKAAKGKAARKPSKPTRSRKR